MSMSSAHSPIVIDASALVQLLLRTSGGERAERAIGASPLVAPDVVNAEVAQALRGLERGGKLTGARASQALARLVESAVTCMPTRALLREAWALRANLSLYDACYVALARELDCSLMTSDGPLTRAPRLGVTLIQI